MSETFEKIGGVTINYEFYDAVDQYNEGDEAEEFILAVLRNERNIYEVLMHDDRFQVLYQLSPRRKYITVPMEIDATDEVLEIGSGMGAVTEGLAEKARFVDCIDLSKRRSIANAYRNQKRNNINIFVGNFEKIKLQKRYDVIVLVGVLEYAQLYIKSRNPFVDFLKCIRDLLKHAGKLYVAIENRLGMKYFSGCIEDHWGDPFVGIEGYPGDKDNNKARTFSKSELEKLFSEAGFDSLYFYYPFPDYKLPEIIYSDNWMPESATLLPHGTVYGIENCLLFDDARAMESLIGTKEFRVFSNSFLVMAMDV
jgi:2-polyprenyl-3-methyl-5-hydroxy-6-metoxy-1,4-benzoquinol methylase